MTKYTILIDMDDTIENLLDTWINYLNEKYNTFTTKSDITSWDISKAFPTLSKEQIFKPLTDKNLWKQVKPLPGAVENISKLKHLGHSVFIVTTASPESAKLKIEYVLNKYFPFISYDDVIITFHKQLIMGDILIDDAPHNLVGGKYRKILFDAPHNKSYDHKKHDMIRVHNWSEIYQMISQNKLY